MHKLKDTLRVDWFLQNNDLLFPAGPLITLHPTSQSVKEGDNVVMKCNARGNPGPSYIWTKGTSEQVNITN